jgi:hypothetical protein
MRTLVLILIVLAACIWAGTNLDEAIWCVVLVGGLWGLVCILGSDYNSKNPRRW